MELNEEKLLAKIAERDRRAELVKYIYEIQGAERERLDFDQAGQALGVARGTVAHDVSALAELRVLILYAGGTLRISPEYLIS